ncbi:NAD(P)-binding protein [Irpex rosettiformis]|uniref:NAD(P)-binding protein n=1 Tax=Irpex rosettiformis TaxID=378272 RepID=A0ACB8U3S6_9APHY|nr:NAD(P)-binding protein [Irpex rosettiformis]
MYATSSNAFLSLIANKVEEQLCTYHSGESVEYIAEVFGIFDHVLNLISINHPLNSMSTRVALVTGGAQGIGEAIALRLARDGFNVAILDVRGKEEKMAAVAQKIEAVDKRSYCVVGDVTDEVSVVAAVQSVVDNLGQLDVMVANAGLCHNLGKSILDSTTEEWNTIFAVNALGTMLCFKHAAKQMIKQGTGGRLIGACSIAGKQGTAYLGAYSAAKFAVRGLTHVMSKELKEHNITVNSYAPGFIYTAMIAHPEDDKNGGRGTVTKSLLGMPSDAPTAEPQVVANLVSYLASPDSGFVTGQIISVDGGMNYD